MVVSKLSDVEGIKNAIVNSRDSLGIIVSNYKNNIANVNTDINSIDFSKWTGPIATLFSSHVDTMKSGIVNGLNNSISEYGTLRKLQELIVDLELACDDYITYVQNCKDADSFANYDTTTGFFREANRESFTNTGEAPPSSDTELNVEECNRELTTMVISINNILRELSSLRFDSVVSFEDERYTSVDYEVHGTPVVTPVVINQYDKVTVTVPGTFVEPPEYIREEQGLTDEDRALLVQYRQELYGLAEGSGGNVYIREIAEETGQNADLKYYTDPLEYLRALCNLHTSDLLKIQEYILPDGTITREGYKRIAESQADGQNVLTDQIVFVDPLGEYAQEFIDAGVISRENYYERFSNVRCFETVREFEEYWFNSEDGEFRQRVNNVLFYPADSALPQIIDRGIFGAAFIPPHTEEMYYLGTDSKGRSYFSRDLEKNTVVLRGVGVDTLGTAQTYLNDSEYLGNPVYGRAFAEARFGFVLTGGNTGDITVENITTYPNGAYTEDADFNTSIVYNNGAMAPEVVESGGHSYDPNNAYHMIDVSVLNPISLAEASQDNFASLDNHPTIEVAPGEQITTRYGGIFDWDWTKESWTIGKNENPIYLCWDEDKQRFYVVSGLGYSTSSRYTSDSFGEGWKYVTIDELRDHDTSVVIAR